MSSYTHLAEVDRQIRSYAAFFVGLPAATGASRTDIHMVNDRHLGQRGNDWFFTRLFSTRQHSDAYKPFLTTSDPVFIRTPSNNVRLRFSGREPNFFIETAQHLFNFAARSLFRETGALESCD